MDWKASVGEEGREKALNPQRQCFSGSSCIPMGDERLTFPYCTANMCVLKALWLVLLVLSKTEMSLCVREKMRITEERKPEWFHTWLSRHLSPFSVRTDPFPLISSTQWECVREKESIQTYLLVERYCIYCIRTCSCGISSSRSVCGRLIWMQLTSINTL